MMSRLALVSCSAVVCLSMYTGCGGTSLAGKVTNLEGEPLEGARVTVVGTLCQASSDAQGAFELPCKPGQWNVAIGHRGYISQSLELEATERKRYDIGARPLIEIPDGTGLFLLRDGAYVPLARAKLARDLEGRSGSPTAMTYCLDREAAVPNQVSAGKVPLFDKEAHDWRVYKLDDAGCAYRKERLDTRWEKTWGERVAANVNELGPEQSIALLPLEAGEYFVADWSNGFFAEAREGADDGRNRYTGAWFVVEQP